MTLSCLPVPRETDQLHLGISPLPVFLFFSFSSDLHWSFLWCNRRRVTTPVLKVRNVFLKVAFPPCLRILILAVPLFKQDVQGHWRPAVLVNVWDIECCSSTPCGALGYCTHRFPYFPTGGAVNALSAVAVPRCGSPIHAGIGVWGGGAAAPQIRANSGWNSGKARRKNQPEKATN